MKRNLHWIISKVSFVFIILCHYGRIEPIFFDQNTNFCILLSEVLMVYCSCSVTICSQLSKLKGTFPMKNSLMLATIFFV